MLNWAIATCWYLGLILYVAFFLFFQSLPRKKPKRMKWRTPRSCPIVTENGRLPDCGHPKDFKVQNLEGRAGLHGSLSFWMITLYGSQSCFWDDVVGDIEGREPIILCSFELGDIPLYRIAKKWNLGVHSERRKEIMGSHIHHSCIWILFIYACWCIQN